MTTIQDGETLPIIQAGTPIEQAAGVLILLHGRGGSAEDMIALGRALKRGILGKSTHEYMKQFTGSDKYWDRVIAAQLGWPQEQPPKHEAELQKNCSAVVPEVNGSPLDRFGPRRIHYDKAASNTEPNGAK